eukprot:12396261-Ditylum_brightwellii.AAC.1
MTSSSMLSRKIKAEPGTKTSESGIRARISKKSCRWPMLYREKFGGKTPELRSFVYDAGHVLQADMYVQTTKEIAQYAGQICKQADNIKRANEKLQGTVIPKLTLAMVSDKITDVDGKVDIAITNIYLKKQTDMYLKRKESYTKNKTKVFNVIIGQCIEQMMSKLGSKTKWTAIEEKHIVVELLQLIKDTAYNIYVIKHSNGNIGEHPRLAKFIRLVEGGKESTDAAVVNASLKKSTEAYFAYAFLSGANQRKYVKLLEDLSNAFLKRKDKYSKTL